MDLRPPQAVQRFDDKLVMRDDKKLYFGTDGDVSMEFDSANRVLKTSAPGAFIGQGSQRLEFFENFLKKPGINNDLDTFTANVTAGEMVAAMVANKDWEITGVNSTSALSTFDADGGVVLTTAGADGDEEFVGPHLATNQSQLGTTRFKPSAKPAFECYFKTGASITKAIIFAGLKLTVVEPTSTDDDAVWFRFEDDVNSGKWQALTSIATVDVATDSGVTAVVSTKYHLAIYVDADRIATMYINGVLVYTSTALTAAAAFKPCIGVAADGAAPGAKAITLYWIKASKDAA